MTTSKKRTASPTSVGAVAIASCLIWAVLAAYSFHAALPSNPVALPGESRVNMRVWAPQWWQFFSRDPRLPRARGYVLGADQHWAPLGPGARSQWQNLFGWQRESEALARELEVFASKARQSDFAACKALPETCLSRMAQPRSTLDKLPRGRVCGHIGIALLVPRPWAWRRAAVTMKSRVARLEVSC
jgi:antimicrobial peptide system SdpA family protein